MNVASDMEGRAMATVHGNDSSETINAFDGVTNIGDTIYGYGGVDRIFGLGGDDMIFGGEGDDWLFGGGDNDWLKGGGGADHLYGDTGSDTVSYGDSSVGVSVFLGPSSGRGYNGTADGDILDSIENVSGSAYRDYLRSDEGANTLAGMAGDDLLQGGADADTLNGGSGADTATYSYSPVGVYVSLITGRGFGGDAEGDRLVSIENLDGSSSVDVLVGDDRANVLWGLGGDDSIKGGGGVDTLRGNNGHDILDGGADADRMLGGTENDIYYVDNASDEVTERAGEGLDTVRISASYVLTPGADVEFLTTTDETGTAAVNLTGNASGNMIRGNDGSNVINGREGDDELTGRGGTDWFLFDTPLDVMFNVDVITDFNVMDDTIQLENTVFGAFAAGALAEERFVVGAALQTNDNIIYDNVTGALFYDSDGSGTAADPILFANVSAGTALTHLDFLVV
jgi:serralysin